MTDSKHTKLYPLGALLIVYFICRFLFQQLPSLKSAFIYPTGLLVNTFNGSGAYLSSEWVYFIDQTKFVLGETCSGTTFFSLLFSYFIYAKVEYKTSALWLLFAYPIALLANSIRVLSSIYAHRFLSTFDAEKYGDYIHVMTGTITFLTCLLIIALMLEKTRNSHCNEKSRITT